MKKAYAFQAITIIAWWLSMCLNEDVYKLFAFADMSRQSFFNFALADALTIAGLSIFLIFKSNRALQYIILGAYAYATLFCLSASFSTDSGWLGTVIMTLGTVFNIILAGGRRLFVRREQRSIKNIIIKMLLQSLVVWSTTLFIFPYLILKSLGQWPEEILLSWRAIAGIFLFLVYSALGLSSSFIMAKYGNGTPLPTDAASQLVTRGPYAFVRNPMAIAGLGQAFAVAIFLGSWVIAIYAIVGMAVWNSFVRPTEEEDLEDYFGQEFRHYHKEVRCWLPRFKAYNKIITERPS